MADKNDVYFGMFSSKEDIEREFGQPGCLDGATVLFAAYESYSYDGEAMILFDRDGELRQAYGSHCSCYGLEDQWKEERANREEIAQRMKRIADKHDDFSGSFERDHYENILKALENWKPSSGETHG